MTTRNHDGIRPGELSARQHTLLLGFSLLLPTMFAVTAIALQVPVAGGEFESEKYTSIAIDWLRNGWIGGADGAMHGEALNTARLPVYPAFIAGIFAIFGLENYVAVLAAQTLLAGLTIWLVALSAGEIERSWIWPGALVAALTLNISYRGTLVLPDNLFTFLTAAVMFTGLRSLSVTHPLRWLLLFAIVGAAAMLCRPVFQFAAFATLPVLALAHWMTQPARIKGAVVAIAIPASIMLAAWGAQVAKVHALTGHAVFSTQTGNHALTWVTPCLAQPLGCGNRDLATLERARGRLSEEMARMSPPDKDNPGAVDAAQRRLAREMMSELEPLSATVSAASAYVKIMLHSVLYEVYQRLAVDAFHLTQAQGASASSKVIGFLSSVATSLPMLLWLASQMIILLSRSLELVGLVSGALAAERRWQTMFLAAMSAGLLLPTLGIGNPRYRAPVEPMLAVLLVQGAAFVLARYRPRRGDPVVRV